VVAVEAADFPENRQKDNDFREFSTGGIKKKTPPKKRTKKTQRSGFRPRFNALRNGVRRKTEDG